MGIALTLIIIFYIGLLVFFRKDFWLCHKNIINDNFFLCLIIFPLIIATLLCIPIWNSTEFLFSSKGYENFISIFKLPIWILSLTATIAAAYAFHHTSKQKNEENYTLKMSIEMQAANSQRETILKNINSASAITISLIKITNNVTVLSKRITGNGILQANFIQHDIDIIDQFWNLFYQDSRYTPAIFSFNEKLQNIDPSIKGLICLALGIKESIDDTKLATKIDNEKFKPLEKLCLDLINELNCFEKAVYNYNLNQRSIYEEWDKYYTELRKEVIKT